MANSDFRQAIIDQLCVSAVPISQKQSGGGWRAVTSRGSIGAQAETMQFGKQRSIPGCIVQFVTFEDSQGIEMDFTCYLIQDDEGKWKFAGGAGGSDGQKAVREHPWVNLGGGGWPDHFYAGGHVIDNGLDVALVRLIANNGTVLEDTVQDGIVLFVAAPRVELPLRAELYDREDRLVTSHDVFNFKSI